MTVFTLRGRVAPWWRGARPRTLGAAVVPVLVGTAAAGHATVARGMAALVVSVAIQVGVNYANDYFDGVRGVDTPARVGPTRLVASGQASPRAVAAAALVSFGAAAVVGMAVALATEPILIAVGVVAVGAAILYSGGPRPYAARGLGEVAVFVFFGVAATAGTALVQAGTVPAAAWWGSIPVGLLAVAILVANNLRDIPTDAAAGKRTLAVRLGDRRTRLLYRLVVVGAFAAALAGVVVGALPRLALLSLGGAVVALRPLAAVGSASGPGLVPILVQTAAVHLTTGVLLALGLWLA